MSLHWLIAALMIYMLFFGEDLIKHQSTSALPSLHASLGITILGLTLVRIVWRVVNPPPALPAGMTAIEVASSKALHFAFYALLIVLPLTGWLAVPAQAVRHPELANLTFFGGTPLPMAPSFGRWLGDAHEILSNAGIALLALHVLAALKHQFIDRDGLLSRMLPV